MKIQIMSDVHTEFHRDSGLRFVQHLDPDGVDVLVVAGDLCSYAHMPKILEELCSRFPHVVYVLGNHESYHRDWGEASRRATFVGNHNPNLHVLDKDVVEIGGQRFVGTTMWFRKDPHSIFFEGELNDFCQIGLFREHVYEENQRAVEFLNKNVQEGDVVVTHHAPTRACLSEEYKTDGLSRFYVCDMDDLIFDNKPKVWFHGHIHTSNDFQHGDTRIVSNPYGYEGIQPNEGFEDLKIIEV